MPTKTKPTTPTPQQQKRRAARIYKKLTTLYPDAHCALTHRNPYELLIATILSAQCTDARVNTVTPPLFKKYPNPKALADAPLPDIENAIRSTGFYRNKAKSLKGAAQQITTNHQGRVPQTMDQLTALPGVARKTANVVLGNAFNTNHGVVVDTHVGRLARRLAFTKHKDPTKVEKDLTQLFPQKNWTQLAHLLIHHGRSLCTARKPNCQQCPLTNTCPKTDLPQP